MSSDKIWKKTNAFASNLLLAVGGIGLILAVFLGIRAVELDGQPVGGKDGKTLKILQDAYAKKYNAETVSR